MEQRHAILDEQGVLGICRSSGVASSRSSAIQALPTTYSNQEETDTRVVLYLHHATALGYKNAVVRTSDTDIFMILLYHADAIKLTVYLDTGSVKHRQLVNLSDFAVSLGEDYCATLLGCRRLHQCLQKEKEKVGPLKTQQNPRFPCSCNSVRTETSSLTC